MTGQMTSRERVKAVLNRSVPDRVPMNYASNPGIDARLKAYFGLDEKDHEGLRQALRIDFRGVGAPYTGARLHEAQEGVNVCPQWGIHRRWVEHGSGGYWDYCDFPLRAADLETVEFVGPDVILHLDENQTVQEVFVYPGHRVNDFIDLDVSVYGARDKVQRVSAFEKEN